MNKFVDQDSGTQRNALSYVQEAVEYGATLAEGADVMQVVLDGKKRLGSISLAGH